MRDLVVNVEGYTSYGECINFKKEEKMKVDCMECGFTYKHKKGYPKCPKCGSHEYTTMVHLAKEFLRLVKSEGLKIVKKDKI